MTWDMPAFLQFVEGVTPTAYAFAIVEQRGGKGAISLRTFVAGEIKNLNVAKPVKSSRLERITSILSTSGSFLSILKVSSIFIQYCLSFVFVSFIASMCFLI